jgi:competence protein ComGC
MMMMMIIMMIMIIIIIIMVPTTNDTQLASQKGERVPDKLDVKRISCGLYLDNSQAAFINKTNGCIDTPEGAFALSC